MSISFEAIRALQAEPLLTGAKTSALILAVGPLSPEVSKEQLEVGIQNAALLYGMAQYHAQENPREGEADARAVADACRILLSAVGVSSPFGRSKEGRKPIAVESIRQSLGPGGLFAMASLTGLSDGAGAVLAVLKGVSDLEDWAERLALRRAAKGRIISDRRKSAGKSAAGAPKNAALGPLFEALEDIYMVAWEGFPSLRRSSTRGDWKEADRALNGGVVARTYETGEELPVGYLRLLCEVFPLIGERGFPVPETPGAIEQSCRRWRHELRAAGTAPFWHRPNALTK